MTVSSLTFCPFFLSTNQPTNLETSFGKSNVSETRFIQARSMPFRIKSLFIIHFLHPMMSHMSHQFPSPPDKRHNFHHVTIFTWLLDLSKSDIYTSSPVKSFGNRLSVTRITYLGSQMLRSTEKTPVAGEKNSSYTKGPSETSLQ